jgi:SLOG in TRPM, prokaryote
MTQNGASRAHICTTLGREGGRRPLVAAKLWQPSSIRPGLAGNQDVHHSLQAGRPVLVLAATGRAAADIADAPRREESDNHHVTAMAHSLWSRSSR